MEKIHNIPKKFTGMFNELVSIYAEHPKKSSEDKPYYKIPFCWAFGQKCNCYDCDNPPGQLRWGYGKTGVSLKRETLQITYKTFFVDVTDVKRNSSWLSDQASIIKKGLL